jgi:hypothetical protein
MRIGELKSLLSETDYKDIPNYDKPCPVIPERRIGIAPTSAWCDENRSLEKTCFLIIIKSIPLGGIFNI